MTQADSIVLMQLAGAPFSSKNNDYDYLTVGKRTLAYSLFCELELILVSYRNRNSASQHLSRVTTDVLVCPIYFDCYGAIFPLRFESLSTELQYNYYK